LTEQRYLRAYFLEIKNQQINSKNELTNIKGVILTDKVPHSSLLYNIDFISQHFALIRLR